MALTRIPSPNFLAHSVAMKAVKLLMPAFAAAYPQTRVMGRKAAIEEKFMMEPLPCATIGFRNTCVGMTVPVRLRLSTFWNCSVSRSKKFLSGAMVAPGMLPPAALSRVSMRPYFAMMSSQFFCTTAWSITSVFMNSQTPPAACISAAILLPTSALRPRMMTLAPSRARYFAMQRPSIPVPPVMTTT